MTETPPPHKQPEFRIVEASFIISSPDLRRCPEPTLPEIAIAGRSNVGKSSLINLLCNQRKLAKTSSTPGKTRLINFFQLRMEPGNHHFHLVDLPGYGYAKVNKAMKQEWQFSMAEFIHQRQLRGILQLIDSRHKPTDQDLQMRESIRMRNLPAVTVLTKLDKLKQNEIVKNKKMIMEHLGISVIEPVVLTSTLKRRGINQVLTAILPWVAQS